MRIIPIGLVLFLGLLGVAWLWSGGISKEPSPIARQKGLNAFNALERSWDRKSILYAIDEIETGEQMNRDEPWLMMARARMYLVLGYRSHKNVDADARHEALKLVKKAAKKEPNHAFIQAFYATQLYHAGEDMKAWELLQKAMKLNPKDPYPVYQVAEFTKDAKDAKQLELWLSKAIAVDTEDRYKDWRISLERSLCGLKNDLDCIDKKWREEIEIDLTNPWPYGNYAGYLRWAKRYPESKLYYEKALALMEYPMARTGLEEVEAIIKSQKIPAER